MEFRIAGTFTDGLARLTGGEQKAAKTAAFDLQLNQAHPALHSCRKVTSSGSVSLSVTETAWVRPTARASEPFDKQVRRPGRSFRSFSVNARNASCWAVTAFGSRGTSSGTGTIPLYGS